MRVAAFAAWPKTDSSECRFPLHAPTPASAASPAFQYPAPSPAPVSQPSLFAASITISHCCGPGKRWPQAAGFRGQLSSSARVMAGPLHTPAARPSRRPRCPPPHAAGRLRAPASSPWPARSPRTSSVLSSKPLLGHKPPPAELSPRADPQAKPRSPHRLQSGQACSLQGSSPSSASSQKPESHADALLSLPLGSLATRRAWLCLPVCLPHSRVSALASSMLL